MVGAAVEGAGEEAAPKPATPLAAVGLAVLAPRRERVRREVGLAMAEKIGLRMR
ncbi:MAG: hypothetical protein VKJ44_05790 [Synechococcus sp.]|nr:hypothetical protein [Synechococcus sp.]